MTLSLRSHLRAFAQSSAEGHAFRAQNRALRRALDAAVTPETRHELIVLDAVRR